jgi:hypothetical protein
MSIDWNVFLPTTALSAATIGATAWLARSLVGQALTKDLEAYKSKLQIASSERQVRFTKLHEKQAELVAELYAKILPAQYCFAALRKGEKSGFSEQDRTIALKLFQICFDAYQLAELNSLYFEEPLLEKIRKFNLEVAQLSGFYLTLHGLTGRFTDVSEDRKRMVEDLLASGWRGLEDTVSPLMNELKNEFRRKLGVTY